MRKITAFTCTILAFALMQGARAADPAGTAEPVLGPGDTVRITVFDDPNLNTE